MSVQDNFRADIEHVKLCAAWVYALENIEDTETLFDLASLSHKPGPIAEEEIRKELENIFESHRKQIVIEFAGLVMRRIKTRG